MKNFNQLTLVLIVLMVVGGCTSETVQFDSIDAPSIKIELLFEIRDNDEILFGDISNVVVTSDGSILITDDYQIRMHIFDAEGNYRKSALNRGRGPGEIEMMGSRIGITDQDDVLIYDFMQYRTSIFKFTGDNLELRRDVMLEKSTFYRHLTSNNELIFLVAGNENLEDEQNDRVIIVDLDGTIKNDNLIEFEEDRTLLVTVLAGMPPLPISSPYHERNIFCFSGDMLIYNRSNVLGFSVYDLPSGEILHKFSLKRPDYPLTIKESQAFIDYMAEGLKIDPSLTANLVAEMPSFKSKVKQMYCDPTGNVWLNTFETDDSGWLIFSVRGELVGSLRADFEGEILSIMYDKIFVKTEDVDGALVLKVFRYNTSGS